MTIDAYSVSNPGFLIDNMMIEGMVGAKGVERKTGNGRTWNPQFGADDDKRDAKCKGFKDTDDFSASNVACSSFKAYCKRNKEDDEFLSRTSATKETTKSTSSTTTTTKSYYSAVTKTTTYTVVKGPTEGKLMGKKKKVTKNGGSSTAMGVDEAGADLTNTACEDALAGRDVELKAGDDVDVDLFEQFYIQSNEEVAAPKGLASGVFSYLMPEANAVSQEDAAAPKTATMTFKVNSALQSSSDIVKNNIEVMPAGASALVSASAAMLAAYTLY